MPDTFTVHKNETLAVGPNGSMRTLHNAGSSDVRYAPHTELTPDGQIDEAKAEVLRAGDSAEVEATVYVSTIEPESTATVHVFD